MWRIMAMLDLVAAAIIGLQLFAPVPWRIAVIFSVYLLIKAWLFFPEFLSLLDGVIGIVILLGLFVQFDVISWASIGVLAYKALPAFF